MFQSQHIIYDINAIMFQSQYIVYFIIDVIWLQHTGLTYIMYTE